MCGYACRDGLMGRIDRDCVSRAVRFVVVFDHLWEIQSFGERGGDRGTYKTTSEYQR